MAQDYPTWFLHQGSINCHGLVIGYANASYYPDSAAAGAFKNACQNYARYHISTISGAEAFWNIEGRITWMGNTFQERSDSCAAAWAEKTLKPLAVFHGQELVLVAAGLMGCDSAFQAALHKGSPLGPQPPWVETLPEEPSFIYALGQSPAYYFEASSWLEAEARGRLQLAKSGALLVQSMQKYSVTMEQLLNEEVDSFLANVQVMARWRDKCKNIFYVLMRMPK